MKYNTNKDENTDGINFILNIKFKGSTMLIKMKTLTGRRNVIFNIKLKGSTIILKLKTLTEK